MRFVVIGIADAPHPYFPPEVSAIIRRGKIFSGGRRHHEIVGDMLPVGSQWIDITVPIDDVFRRYQAVEEQTGDKDEAQVIVFASGDPLFFGFANTIRRKMPDAEIQLFPSFNSLQMLAHRLVMPYHDMRIVSLTGRPWPDFDRALIEHAGKIGVLTDREHTPSAIARRMMDFGYVGYDMVVGEHLGNPQQERVRLLSLQEAAQEVFALPNCIILRKHLSSMPATDNISKGEKNDDPTVKQSDDRPVPIPYPIPDHLFELLDGREKMITKAPIRLLTLAALELDRRQSLWDIGFCTGSVSIEARLRHPHLRVTAFEIRPEGERLMQVNSRRFGAPGIETHIGDFLAIDCDPIASACPPDAIFIGGHGGKLPDIISKACSYLRPGGVIVYNCVQPSSVTDSRIRTDSRQLFCQTVEACGLSLEPSLHVAINDYHPIDILKAIKLTS